MVSPLQKGRLQPSLLAGLIAVTSFIGTSQAQSQTTAAPVLTASIVGSTTTLTITDATPGSSIYYATGSATSSYAISMSFFFDQPYTVGNTAILTAANGGPSADFTDAGTGTCYSNTPLRWYFHLHH